MGSVQVHPSIAVQVKNHIVVDLADRANEWSAQRIANMMLNSCSKNVRSKICYAYPVRRGSCALHFFKVSVIGNRCPDALVDDID